MPVVVASDQLYLGSGALNRLYLGSDELWRKAPTLAAASATWAFTGSSAATTATSGNVTGATATAGAAKAAITMTSQGYSSDPVMSLASVSATASDARASDSYVTFTVTATGPWQPKTLTFDGAKASSAETRGWTVTTSADNYAASMGSNYFNSVRPTLSSVSVDLSSLGTVSAVFSVRLYAYVTGGTSRTIEVDNVVVSGMAPTSTAAPAWKSDRYLLPAPGKFQFGMYVPSAKDSSVNRGSADLAASEARFGRSYSLANIYHSATTTTASVAATVSRINDHLNAGRVPRVDLNPGGVCATAADPDAATATYWKDVGNGIYDDDFTAANGTAVRGLRYLLTQLMSQGQRLIVTLHHEGDLKNETGGRGDIWFGTEADFRSMWQHTVTLARSLVSANSSLLEPVWFLNFAYDPKVGNSNTSLRKWGDTLTDDGSDGMYPGHAYVDRVGPDPYNGAAWTGHSPENWRSFAGTLGQFGFKDWWMSHFATGGARTAALATNGQGVYKPAMLGEMGTMERWASFSYTAGGTTDARQWMKDFGAYVSPGGGAYTTTADNETGTRDASKPWLVAAMWFGRDYPSGAGSMYSDLTASTGSPQWGINPESPQKWAGLADLGALTAFQ